jgi:hypothetical protein
VISFNEITIRQLFGHEAAEDEDIEQLKKYYFKNKVYERFVVDLPLRILVGHKGTGKSALFKMSIQEDIEKGYLPIQIQPNDIIDINTAPNDFLKSIREWEQRLTEKICKKVLVSLGVNSESNWDIVKGVSGKILSHITDSVKSEKYNIDLNPTKQLLLNNFLKNNKIIVYIDDLDRGWVGKKEDITRLSALLNAARDIINENKGIHFRIALRSDVYYLIRTSDESTDKIESSVIWYGWNNHDILKMLVKRIESFFDREIDEGFLKHASQPEMAKYIVQVMESNFSGYGKWRDAPIHKILMSLVRKRPRDLVKLCTLAARRAYEDDSQKILTKHFKEIFDEYSQGRVQDTINEYITELPDIERLILNMKPNKAERKNGNGWVYTPDLLTSKIKNIIQSGSFKLSNGKVATEKQLANFLYKINFMTARKEKEDGEVVRKYFEENRYISGEHSDFGFNFEIHPAYRWALQVDSIEDIYKQLELSSDD